MTQEPRDQQLKLDAKEREEPTAEELEAPSADTIGIDDPVRMYLREIGKVALLTAEEGPPWARPSHHHDGSVVSAAA